MPKRTTKLLTLELDLKTLAEFSAAAEISGARSKSTFLNQYVVQKIREAKGLVTPEEFAEFVEKHTESIEKRSAEIKHRAAIKSEGKSIITNIKAKKPENAVLNFNGEKTKQSKTKAQKLEEEMDAAIEARNKNK